MTNRSDWTKEDIYEIWATLEAGGLNPPQQWSSENGKAIRVKAVEIWRVGMGKLTPDEGKVAAIAYAAKPDRSDGYAGPAHWPDADQVASRGRRLLKEFEGNRLFSAPEAWAKVVGLIGTKGGYFPPGLGEEAGTSVVRRITRLDGTVMETKPEFRWSLDDDPLQRAALEFALAAIGGWSSHCKAKEGDPSPRARFQEAYTVFVHQLEIEEGDRAVLAQLERRRRVKAIPEVGAVLSDGDRKDRNRE